MLNMKTICCSNCNYVALFHLVNNLDKSPTSGFKQIHLFSILRVDTCFSYYNCSVSYSDIVYLSEAVRCSIQLLLEKFKLPYGSSWKKLWEKRFSDILQLSIVDMACL